MKKIKKMVVMLMIVAMMFGGMVFGADPIAKQFDINTSVAGKLELKISKVPSVSIADWGKATDMTGTSLKDASPVQLYLHILNNQKVNIRVNVSATAFSNTDTATSYVIPYDIIKDAGTTIAVGADWLAETAFATIDHDNRGLRVDTVGFSVDPYNTAFTNAAAGDYKSTITFNVYAP